MGLHENFVDTVTCPECGEEEEISFQTKKLGGTLSRWEPGDTVEIADGVTVSGTVTDLIGHHSCGEVDKEGALSGIESANEALENEEFSAARHALDDAKHRLSPESVTLKADAVIEDGTFVGLENVRKYSLKSETEE